MSGRETDSGTKLVLWFDWMEVKTGAKRVFKIFKIVRHRMSKMLKGRLKLIREIKVCFLLFA